MKAVFVGYGHGQPSRICAMEIGQKMGEERGKGNGRSPSNSSNRTRLKITTPTTSNRLKNGRLHFILLYIHFHAGVEGQPP